MSDLPENLRNTLAHHEAEIRTLGGRMTGVESSVHRLQGEVHTGFAALSSKLDRLDAQPKFEVTKTLSLVKDFALLIGFAVASILYVANGQYGTLIAEQKGLNALVHERITNQQKSIEKLSELARWTPQVKRPD